MTYILKKYKINIMTLMDKIEKISPKLSILLAFIWIPAGVYLLSIGGAAHAPVAITTIVGGLLWLVNGLFLTKFISLKKSYKIISDLVVIYYNQNPMTDKNKALVELSNLIYKYQQRFNTINLKWRVLSNGLAQNSHATKIIEKGILELDKFHIKKIEVSPQYISAKEITNFKSLMPKPSEQTGGN